MSNELNPKTNPGQPVVYQIRIEGHLGCEWADWFGGLTVTLEEDGDTLLTGPIVDQAALYGLLKKVRDLGMPLVSVVQVQFNETHPYRSKKEYKVNSINKTARIAGFLYLLVAVFSGFAASVRSNLIVPADAAATVHNIAASGTLFRLNIASDLVGQIFHIFLALALYELLKTVNKNQALLMVILALIPVPMAMLNQLNQFAVLPLLSGTDYTQVMFFLNLQNEGVLIAQIFWGLWLFPLGYLVFKSGYIPRILGVLLVVAGLGYLIDSFGKFLLPSYGLTISLFTFVGEVLLLLWLLIKGVNVGWLEKRALESAS